MKQMLLRIDDFGYSEGNNYGILKTIESGLVKNVGLMSNMKAAPHAVSLLKNHDILLGLHANISGGRPVLDPQEVKSLVDQNGFFHHSSEYNSASEDFVDRNEAVNEVTAQVERFRQLTGKLPAYLDFHAVFSENFIEATKIVAEKYQLCYVPLPDSLGDIVLINDSKVLEYPGSDQNQGPEERMKFALDELVNDDYTTLLIYHPGYIDQYILDHSSLTLPRAADAAMLSSEYTQKILRDHEIKLVNFDQL